MAKAKLILVLFLVAVTLIVVFQNTESVETKFLFLTVTMPRAALLAITGLIGVAVGIVIALGLAKKRTKKAEEPPAK